MGAVFPLNLPSKDLALGIRQTFHSLPTPTKMASKFKPLTQIFDPNRLVAPVSTMGTHTLRSYDCFNGGNYSQRKASQLSDKKPARESQTPEECGEREDDEDR